MQVVVDALIYQRQRTGGVSRLFNELLPRMCDLDASLRIRLLIDGNHAPAQLRQPLPQHPQIIHRPIPRFAYLYRPRRLWRHHRAQITRVLRELWIGQGRDAIWHSTYYTLPGRWQGRQVVTVYDMLHERFADRFTRPKDLFVRTVKRKCMAAADAVICISETTKQDLVYHTGVEPDKVHVVQLAPSPTFRVLDHVPAVKGERPFFLFVGQRRSYKNFELLLQTYGRWPGRAAVDLLVVGPLWNKAELHMQAALGLNGKVHLLTQVDDLALCELYNQAAGFVYPSLYEGFGLPLLEAMASGCPVIASCIPSSVEVAESCPIYFDPESPEQLRVAFDTVLAEGRRSQRVNAGLRLVQRYSWPETARKTLDVYRSLT